MKNLRFSYRANILIITIASLVLFGLIYLYYSPYFISKIKFFYLMNQVPAWVTRDAQKPFDDNGIVLYPLDEVRKTAHFLLNQSEQDRHRLITEYTRYANTRSDGYATSSKLYILLRMLFNVSEDHPTTDVKYFLGCITFPARPSTDDAVNLLWPIGYQDEILVVKGVPIKCMGVLNYDGIGEYEYFLSRFPFRNVDDLK